MCLYPKLYKNKKYEPNKKNKGHPPECRDPRTKAVPIACGKCIECLKAKKREWQIRLQEEIKEGKPMQFVTLTFSEKELKKLTDEIGTTEAHQVTALAVERFRERWRRRFGKSIKHWLIDELGHQNTNRVHLHGILWTADKDAILERWGYGTVFIGEYVNARTINYIVKYITKLDNDHKGFMGRMYTSKGIGSGYFKNSGNAITNKYKEGKTNENYRLENGAKTAMPIYYRNHIYSEEEREKLWIEKLDKNIRYVRGDKIDVSTEEGIEIYKQALEYQQRQNITMGYGSTEWSKKNYEASRKQYGMDKAIKDQSESDAYTPLGWRGLSLASPLDSFDL